jgi:hypothetical protein
MFGDDENVPEGTTEEETKVTPEPGEETPAPEEAGEEADETAEADA